MKHSKESSTFLARRSCRSNNHEELQLKRVEIDSEDLPKRTKISMGLNRSVNPESTNRSSLAKVKVPIGKQLFVKTNRFKNLISMFQESVYQTSGNESIMRKAREQVKRQIINRKGQSRLSQATGTLDRQLTRSIVRQDHESKLKLHKPNDRKRRRYRSQLRYYPSTQRQPTQSTLQYLQEIENKKINQKINQKEDIQKSKQITPSEANPEDDVQKIVDAQSNLNVNSDVTIERILNEFDIKNQKQLNRFLQQNQYLSNVHQSTSHPTNLVLGTETPITQYEKTYRYHQTIDNTSFSASNYECLPELHLKKPSLRNLKTSNCWDFYQKPMASVPSCIPEVEEYAPLEQITYKTSYQHAFNYSKPKPKQIESQKPYGETLIRGGQFHGTTQYNKDFRKNQQKFSKTEEKKEKFNELLYNKHKNGDSHNTFTTKGFQLLRTSYNQQFSVKQPNTQQILHSSQQNISPSTQLIEHIKTPIGMYETTAYKSYRAQDTIKNKRKTVTPWKYHVLSQLQALISLDKDKSKLKRKSKI